MSKGKRRQFSAEKRLRFCDGTWPTRYRFGTYDPLGRLTRIEEGGSLVAAWSYGGSGRVRSVELGDGSRWTAGSWDGAWRRLEGTVFSGETVFFQEQMVYDAADQVTAVVWGHSQIEGHPEAQVYEHDELGRLVGFRQGKYVNDGVAADGARFQHTWELDEQANWRRHSEGQELTVPVNGVNAYTAWPVPGNAAPGLSLEYDAASGFLWSRELNRLDPNSPAEFKRYVHDGLGRLVQVRKVAAEETTLVSFGYDVLGRLAWRQEGGTGLKTYFVYDGPNVVQEMEEVRDLAGHPTGYTEKRHYLWAGGRLLKSKQGVDEEQYHHQDRLGSVVLSTRPQTGGNPTHEGHRAYDPYGREVSVASWGPGTLEIPYGYAGARGDLMTDTDNDDTPDSPGLYLMGARWYLPELGRFLEQDPLGEEGGLNLYSYTGSSPVLWVDPTGLAPGRVGVDQRHLGPRSSINTARVTVDGVNTTDVFTGGQRKLLNYKMDGGGTDNPNQEAKPAERNSGAKGSQPPGTTDNDNDGTTDNNSGSSTKNNNPGETNSSETPASKGNCPIDPIAPLTTDDANRMEAGETVDLEGLTPDMREAVDTLRAGVDAAGGTIEITSAFRPPEYQTHLQEVWDKHRALTGNTNPECATTKEQVDREFSKHGLVPSERPAGPKGKHTQGLAIDAKVVLPALSRVSIDDLAHVAGLSRPFPVTDKVHFILAK